MIRRQTSAQTTEGARFIGAPRPRTSFPSAEMYPYLPKNLRYESGKRI